MPKAGTQLLKDSIVKIYSAGHEARVSQTVPDLKESLYPRQEQF